MFLNNTKNSSLLSNWLLFQFGLSGSTYAVMTKFLLVASIKKKSICPTFESFK